MAYYCYIRGFWSLDSQRSACLAHAPLAGVFSDMDSVKRPGLSAAIAALNPGDTLLVTRKDRLARDIATIARIEEFVRNRGARIVYLTDPDS